MPAYWTPPRDFTNRRGNPIRYRIKDFPRKSPYGHKTLQQGTNASKRQIRRKNACKLVSNAEIRRASRDAMQDVIGTSMEKAFPPLEIK